MTHLDTIRTLMQEYFFLIVIYRILKFVIGTGILIWLSKGKSTTFFGYEIKFFANCYNWISARRKGKDTK